MPQNANSGSAFRRVGIFILAMFLGVVIFLGAVAGTVYYALNYVTVKKLSEKNIDIGADAVLTPESPLREYSVMRLFKEFSTLELLLAEKNKETATLHDFLTVYGLKVPDPVMERIPEEYKNIRIADLETRGPANAFLDATRISSPLQLAGLRTAVSDDAWNLLSARSVSLLVERKFETALAGIYLGDLTGVKLVRREGTAPEVIYTDPTAPTLEEYLAPYELSALGKVLNGTSSVYDETKVLLGMIPLTAVLSPDDGFLLEVAKRKSFTLADFITKKDDKFAFTASALLDEITIGEILGYTYDESTKEFKKDGKKAVGIDAALAPLRFNDLSGDFDLMDKIGDVYIGELIGYTLLQDENGNLIDEDGNPLPTGTDPVFRNGSEELTGMMKRFSSLQVRDLKNDNIMTEKINGTTLGDALGYTNRGTETDPAWYDKNDRAVTGIFAALADSKINALNDKVKELSVATLLDYEYNASTGKWEKDGSPASGILTLLMDSTSTTLSDDVNGIYVAEIMDYSAYDTSDPNRVLTATETQTLAEIKQQLKAEGKLGFRKKNADDTYSAPSGPAKALADLTVADLSDENKIVDKIDQMTVGDAMGYEKDQDGKWKKNGKEPAVILGLLMESSMNTLSDDVNRIYVAEIMGYEKDSAGKWKNKDGKEPSGPIKAFADLTVADLSDEKKITDKIDSMLVGDAMGYEKVSEGKWKDKKEKAVTGTLAAIMDTKIDELNTRMADLTLAEVMGYKEVSEGNWQDAKGNAVDGFMKLIGPDTKVNELDTRADEMKDLPIGKFMDAGILKFDDGTTKKLDSIFGADIWKGLTLQQFIDGLLNNKIPSSSSSP